MPRLSALLFVLSCFMLGCSSGTSTGNAAPEMMMARMAPQAAAAPGGKPEAAPVNQAAIERRIIHTATVEVQAPDLETVQSEVETLAIECKGYISKSDIQGRRGSNRRGSWTLKVPTPAYRTTLTKLLKLGTPIKNNSDSQDVTEEFVDLTARIKNMKTEEETLNKLLKDSALRIEDILKLREAISKVRMDIERAEGRLKFLTDRTDLATIDFLATEEIEYKPTAPVGPQTFTERVSNSFTKSWWAMVDSLELFLLFLVSWLPYLPFPAGFLALGYMIRRTIRSKPPASAQPGTST
ncbi:MAG: DUF4349 domain-containing protein [Fimbriiglobus sp.]